MSWKKLPYWLKGGIIGGSIGLLLAIFSNMGTFVLDISYPRSLVYLSYPALYVSGLLIFSIIGCKSFGCVLLLMPLFGFLVILQGFIIGAIIGWIVGKIKSKKRK